MNMSPKLEETIIIDFITSSPTTGAALDADSTPTCEVFEDANDTAILTPAVTKRTGKTGDYRVSVACTAANGFEAGKSYNVVVSATVAAIAAKAVAKSFLIRTYSVDDIAAIVNAIKVKSDNLPADPADASDIAVSFTAVNAKLDTVAGYVDTEVAAIKAKTDQLVFASGDVKATLDFETVTVAVNNDKTGYSLTSAYDAAKTAATQGSLDAVDDFLDTEIAAIKAKTDNLPDDPADASDIADSFVTVNEKLDTIDLSGIDSVKVVTDKLDTALEPDGAVYRYTGNALEQAPVGGGNGGGDPWLIHLPGSYAAGTAGKILGDNLDVPVGSRSPATVFSGMTSVAEWLGLIAGKQTGNAAARTEIRATGAGSGTYDETTDSQEAIRDRGDFAWLGTGGASSNGSPECFPNPARTLGPTTEPVLPKV